MNRHREAPEPADIAIIGMSCILPKAPDVTTYWRNILTRVDAITEIPPDRWDWHLYYDPDPQAKDKVYSKWGGFIDDVPFEPMSYGMPPNSVTSIEPLQLLTLEAVRAALKDAGYLDRPFDRDKVGVILGAGGAGDLGQDYVFRAGLSQYVGADPAALKRLDQTLPQWTEDSFAGILMNVAAGRVANRFDLGGPNYTVDAACASSLAAIYLAVRELQAETSDMVVVGGADTIQSPFAYLCFSKTHALSPTGHCRPFDAKADGIAISEGIGIVLLKRLADAERDGDRIYAVIKAVAGASDGKDKGLTAPRPEGQVRTLRRAYSQAGVSPATVSLFEAHGTGTVAGDRAELESLTRVLDEAQAAPRGAAVGSVKSMIGHTKNTAGVAGLMKVALALHRKVLPPTLGVEAPNPKVAAATSPLYVNTEARPWMAPATGSPRRAAVSAFGFGGTNFHAVLEEYRNDYPLDPSRRAVGQRPGELLLWRASSRTEIRTAVDTLARTMSQSGASLELADVALSVYRAHGAETPAGDVSLAIVAISRDDLCEKLEQARQYLDRPAARTVDPRGIYICDGPLARDGKVAVLFPGQGSQHVDMLRDLAVNFVEVRQQLERADRALDGVLPQPLSSYIFPPPGGDDADIKARREALTQTNVAQPAMGAAGLAALRLAEQFGVRPDLMAGHSYGEYVALCAAGVFSEDDLFILSEARGRFMVEGANLDPGGMAAVEAGPGEVGQCLAGLEGVVVANHNAPKQTIISGTRPALEAAVQQLKSAGLGVRTIPVACAFHSPVVAPAQEKLNGLLSSMTLGSPSVPVFSNTTAAPHDSTPAAIAGQLVEHTVAPVRFADEIEAMYLAGARIFLEAGPRSVLTGLVDQILGDRPHLAVAIDQQGRPPMLQLLHCLGRLAVEGVPITLDRIFEGGTARVLDLQQPLSPPSHGPTTWLINGGYARPARQEPRPPRIPAAAPSGSSPTLPVSVANGSRRQPPDTPDGWSASSTPASREVPVPREVSVPREVPVAPLAHPVRSSATPAPVLRADGAVPADSAQVMSQFQQLMQRFLETQQTVMLAYLRGGTATSAAPRTAPASPATVSPVLTAPVEVEAPRLLPISPQVAAPPAVVEQLDALRVADETPPAPVLDEATVIARLLEIVSERTGYPSEMLDLDVDLEADLGIDSIKRIEILGSYQQRFGAEAAGDEAMEKLTSIRTLRGVVAWMLTATAGSSGAAAGPTATLAPPDEPAVIDEATLIQRLLSIVSERTGYPAEMIGLDQDLEADLGIDSIKRIEILGNYQQQYVSREEMPGDEAMEKLTSIRTLRGIVTWLAKSTDAPSAPVASAGAPDAAASPVIAPSNGGSERAASIPTGERHGKPLRRSLLATGSLGNLNENARADVVGVVVITDDESGIAEAVLPKLAQRGQSVALVRRGAVAGCTPSGSYEGDLATPTGVAELLDLIRQRHGRIGGLVHLLPLSSAGGGDVSPWRERVEGELKSLYHLARCLDADLRQAAESGGACLLAFTAMGGMFGLEESEFFPGHGALAGFVKTVSHEWPDVRVKVVDVNRSDATGALADRVVAELYSAVDAAEVGYREDRRLTLMPAPAALVSDAPGALAVDRSSVILITGGARGITADVARHLARHYQPTLIVAGRSPLPAATEEPDIAGLATPRELKAALIARAQREGQSVSLSEVEEAYNRVQRQREVRDTLEALQATGARVEYVSVDVRDEAALSALVERIYQTHGRLDGVIHGAGVIEDKLLRDKTPSSFDRVFDTKVAAAFTLSRVLRPDALRFLVFFSSVAGTFGNRGQADYAAANEVLNKLALQLDRSWPGRVVSVNWGPWASGMVGGELERQFAARGIEVISREAGCRALDEELRLGKKGEAVVILTAGRHDLSGPRPTAGRRAAPLLDGAGVEGNGNGHAEFPLILDPARDVYLEDHKLSGKPVLPLAVACEMMAEAAAQAAPGLDLIAVRDLVVLRGVVLENGVHPIRVTTKPLAMSSAGAEIEVTITGGQDPRHLHYRCVAELARSHGELATHLPPGLTEGRPFPLSVDEAYRWLFHGPRFRGIRAVTQITGDGIVGSIATSSPRDLLGREGAAGWLVDPLVIDSSLQLVLFWLRVHRDVAALPSGFRRYRRFAALSGPVVECRVHISGEPDSHIVNANAAFVDDAGRMVGLVEEFTITCSKSLIPMFESRAEV